MSARATISAPTAPGRGQSRDRVGAGATFSF